MKLLIDEPPLQVLPSLAVLIGLNEAIALQQLHYWLTNKNKKGERPAHYIARRWWVYNSYDGWKEDFPFWSVTTIKRAFLSLEKRGLVTSRQFEQREREMRKWYTINYDRLERLSSGADQIRPNWPDASDHTGPVNQANSAPSAGSNRPDGSGQSGRISHAETNTTATTHTPPPWQTGVWSRHDLEVCRRYAQWLHDTKRGIHNPEGFARACYQTGLDDKCIDQFLADEASGAIMPPASIADAYAAAGLCPACGARTTEPCSNDPAICPLAQDKEVGCDFTQAAP
jgi:hypothetical protein